MRYEPSLPDAVFLGPSLAREQAWEILPANYYPPVRMGDIYRLLTSGVRRICIIDGVFHATTPVWQREILAALQAGIQVVGAASMGALRALELSPYGMLGCGLIYRWYAQGVIAGDDEVAMLHAPAEFGYQALSEPLVDLRYTLLAAVRKGILDDAAAAALLAHQKSLCFTQRGASSLLASPACQALAQAQRVALAGFLQAPRPSLKALDAAQALQFLAEGRPLPAPRLKPRAAGLPRPQSLLLRGVPTADGELVPLQAVLAQCAADSGLVGTLVARNKRRFLLIEWMGVRGVRTPPAHCQAHREAWVERHVGGDLPAWCRAHGMTLAELDAALAEQAAEDWLLRHAEPADFGLSASPGDPAAGYIADWATELGLEPAPGLGRSAAPICEWVLAHEPAQLGLDHWSAAAALIRELQLSAELRRFLPAQETHCP